MLNPVVNHDLHSTMYLLIHNSLKTDYHQYKHLHSTMYLLIRINI